MLKMNNVLFIEKNLKVGWCSFLLKPMMPSQGQKDFPYPSFDACL